MLCTKSKRRSNASTPEPTASAKCRANQFHTPGLRPSHLQDLRSNARPKLKNEKRQCVSDILSSPFSVLPMRRVVKEKKTRSPIRKISCPAKGNHSTILVGAN